MADSHFLRAESYFNVATEIERIDRDDGAPRTIPNYGGRSLHEQSHGESFFALFIQRLSGPDLYLLDEPEAARRRRCRRRGRWPSCRVCTGLWRPARSS